MNRFRTAREIAGFTQKQVALELKVSAPTVSEWESGRKNPSKENLEGLADLFGVSVDYLLGRDDDPQQSPTRSDNAKSSDDDVLFALFGKHGDEITDEDMEDVRLALELVKKLRRDKEGH